MTFPLIKNTSRNSRFLIFMMLLIFGLAFSSVLGFFFTLSGSGISNLANLQITQICSQIIGFILPAVVYALIIKEKPFEYLGFNRLPSWSLLGTVAMFTVIPFISAISEWNDSMVFPESMAALEKQLRALNDSMNALSETMMNGGSLLINLLIFGVLAAISEELLFRSVIQQSLMNIVKNSHVAIIATAVIFSAFHGDFFGFVPRLFLGLMLGYMFYLSGSIIPSMLMHFVNNAIIVMLYFLNKKELIYINVDTFGQTDNLLVIILSLTVTIAIFWICYRYKNRTNVV